MMHRFAAERQQFLASLAAGSLLLASCGGTVGVSSTSAAAQGSARPSGGPSISAGAVQAGPPGASINITQPKDGSTVDAGDLTVNYDVIGAVLVPASEATKLDDYHVHVLLDVDPAPYTDRSQPVPTGDDKMIHTAAATAVFKNVAAGKHTVTVFLSTSNHISVKPPVIAKSTFTAQ